MLVRICLFLLIRDRKTRIIATRQRKQGSAGRESARTARVPSMAPNRKLSARKGKGKGKPELELLPKNREASLAPQGR